MTRKQAQEEAQRRWGGTPIAWVVRWGSRVERTTKPGIGIAKKKRGTCLVGYYSGHRRKDFYCKGSGRTWEEAFEQASASERMFHSEGSAPAL
jgi:hypothetical protein